MEIVKPKRLDIFILKSFLLLFVGTFFVCLFILLMNVVWRYIEDLVGKGFTLGVLAKFFYYFSLTSVPMALPLAVLLASLITFGNFGERLELLAMKTAGISLLRIMRPLTIFSIILAGVSFYFQDVVAPNTSKKLYSLVYSMQQKSPELEIPEGVFYNQIDGFNLYVKHKDPNTGTLHDVTIYDVSGGYENISVIVADSGRLETTADKGHLYLRLYNGEMFENMRDQQMNRSDNPYRRESFREKHFLIEFDSDFTLIDESAMSSQAASKNMVQIRHTIDSLSLRQDSIGLGNLEDFRYSALNTYRLSTNDSLKYAELLPSVVNVDSLFAVSSRAEQLDIRKTMYAKITTQKSELSLKGVNMFYGDRTIRRHWIEWMKKITQSLSIVVFFFIGASLGAIIRKGGLGVPVIVSVFTFILYHLSSISGEKMFREGEWSIIGCWLSLIILSPLAAFFTVKANGDSTIFQIDVYKEFLRYWFGGRVKRNIQSKEVIIEEPDNVRCVAILEGIVKEGKDVLDLGRLRPSYIHLFFKPERVAQMEILCYRVEDVVGELCNSRDRYVLDRLNSMPIVPTHGTKPPFQRVWANRMVGILFPIGLLFHMRACLFSRYEYREFNRMIERCEELITHLKREKK